MRLDGAKVRRLRENAGLSLGQFAKRAKLSPSHLSMIERDQREASPPVASRIAKALGTSIANLRPDHP